MALIVMRGATGSCGGAVARRLLGYGHQVRALGRSRDRLQPLVDAGAQVAVGDATDPRYLADAVAGADRACTLLPDDLRSTAHRAWQDRIDEATHGTGLGFSTDVATLFTAMSRAVNNGLVRTEEGRTAANTTSTPSEEFADTFAEAYLAVGASLPDRRSDERIS